MSPPRRDLKRRPKLSRWIWAAAAGLAGGLLRPDLDAPTLQFAALTEYVRRFVKPSAAIVPLAFGPSLQQAIDLRQVLTGRSRPSRYLDRQPPKGT